MKPKIIYYQNGNREIAPLVSTLSNLKNEFEELGIDIEEHTTRSIEPISTLVISIIGTIASNYIIKLIDILTKKKDENPKSSLVILINYKSKQFYIPNNRDELISEFNKK